MNWNNTSYQKIINAKFANEHVIVSFENGDVIEVPTDPIIPFGIKSIEWENMRFSPFEIIIPATPNDIEIPWDKLRVITDKNFGKYLAERSEEQSKLIGVKIKRLREKKGISSKDLAERAGLTPQTISRIEQGHTDVGFSTLRKILASMGYSLKDLASQEAEYENQNVQKTFNLLIKRLSYAGIDSHLLTQKIIPVNLQNALNAHRMNEPNLLLDEAASYVSNIFGWHLDEIWSDNKLIIQPQSYQSAFFKKSINANENQIKAYSHYAYHLAKVVLKANQNKIIKEYPDSLETFRKQYFKKHKTLDLKSLLTFVWDLGISVMPLNDPGVFHGASWNIEGKHVIVLKQNTKSHARWIFDLLHEVYHVFAHLENINSSVIEVEELNPFSNNDSSEELEANSFANQLIFDNRAEYLAEECVSLANWDIKNLYKSVVQVADKEKVRKDFLANYLAFRLAYQGENWWGSAMKFQITTPNPFDITSQILSTKINTQKINPVDINLLNAALTN